MPNDRKVEQRRNEQGQFTGEFFFSEPPPLPSAPPALPPSAQDDRDAAFMADFKGQEPPPLPPAAEEEGLGDVAAAGVKGAAGGAIGGGVPGAVVGGITAAGGAAAGYLLGKATKPSPIGTLEGGSVKGDDSAIRGIQELISIQKQISRVGSPIKDAITTQAAGSRM